jgi:hypothetical protein
MSGSSGACETNGAASEAACSAAAAASPELAAPRESHKRNWHLELFQQRWWEQQFDGVSAQEFANKYNLTVKSVTDQTFLTAGDNLCGCKFGEWVEGGNHAEFNATDLRNYKNCLQSDTKSVSNIYLALNRFAHPSARISLQGYLEQIFKDLPLAQVGGRNEIYLMRFEIKKGKEEEFLKEARKINDRRHWNESKANKQLAWEKIEAHFKAAAVKGFTLYGGKSFVGGEQAVSFISNHWCFFSYCFLSP